MPAVVVAKPDDEIVDLIDRVRSSGDPDVGLVVPSSSRALQTPLNVRLLAQFSNQSGRRTAIVSEDPRVQQLARANGLQIYGSVPAFERGIELAAPRVGGVGQARNIAAGAATGTAAAAVLEPPPAPPPAPPTMTPPVHAPAPARLEPRRVITQIPPARPSRGWDRRRLLYAAGAALAIIGIVLFMTLSPSAKITLTIAATPLAVNATIQGSTSASQANKPDHVLTRVVTSTASQTFQASPTGTKTLPATPAKVSLTFSTDSPNDISFQLSANNTSSGIQTADQSTTFAPTRNTVICIGPDNPAPKKSACGSSPYNSSAPYVDLASGAAGNVAAGSVTSWQGDPCPSLLCPGIHITVANTNAATGGTDPKQVTSASASDVSSWTQQVQNVEAQLTSQLNTDLQARAAGKAFAVDPSGNGKTIVFAVTPPLPPVNAQFATTTFSVSASAQAAAYDPAAVRIDVLADLDKLVKPGEQLAPGRLSTPPCTVTQASTNGTVVLACSATDFSQPQVDLSALKAQLSGRNPGSAAKIVKDRLPQVQSVHVSESPFQLFYLPLFASKIEIDENFVAPSTSSSTSSPSP
jgi:hypothetical protein